MLNQQEKKIRMNKNHDIEITNESISPEERSAMKESIMDFAGHFSTASAILAGFYMATCAFIIGVKAQGNNFPFLDEPLLAEIPFLGDFIQDLLSALDLSDFWPTHFEYMLMIFISLFLISLLSYACFLNVGMMQMSVFKSDMKKSDEKLFTWQQRGMNTLFISLMFSFVTLPWALLRFAFDQALVMAIMLLATVIVSLIILVQLLGIGRKIHERIRNR